jgi:hypothetical protein
MPSNSRAASECDSAGTATTEVDPRMQSSGRTPVGSIPKLVLTLGRYAASRGGRPSTLGRDWYMILPINAIIVVAVAYHLFLGAQIVYPGRPVDSVFTGSSCLLLALPPTLAAAGIFFATRCVFSDPGLLQLDHTVVVSGHFPLPTLGPPPCHAGSEHSTTIPVPSSRGTHGNPAEERLLACSPLERRMFFCSYCYAFVTAYDHHCGVIGACIGGQNIKSFVAFLFCTSTACVVAAASPVAAAFHAFRLPTVAEIVQSLSPGNFPYFHRISLPWSASGTFTGFLHLAFVVFYLYTAAFTGGLLSTYVWKWWRSGLNRYARLKRRIESSSASRR